MDTSGRFWFFGGYGNDKTMVTGKLLLSKIKKGKETKVVWKGTEKNPVASLIKPKPPLTVADEKQVSFKELQDLIRAKDKGESRQYP